MHTKLKLKFSALSLLAATPLLAQQKPNVLFIMTDQQRFDALAIVGKYPFLKTPNLDKLAKEGVIFQRAYTQCAVSAPARGSLLTGCTVENHGIYTNEFDRNSTLPMKTFDQLLVDEGYYAEYHGKWHSPLQPKECYSKFSDGADYKAFLTSGLEKQKPGKGERLNTDFKQPYRPNPMDAAYDEEGDYSNKAPKEVKSGQPDYHGELLMPLKYSMTNYQGNQVIEAIKRAKETGKPFSITCSFGFPHAPMLPIKPYYGMYPVNQMPVSPSINDDMKNNPYLNANNRLKLMDYSDSTKIKYMMSDYFALITEIDTKVGEILATLKQTGMDKNTLVIFTSDHGEMLGSHGMREKNIFLEESARVPLIIRFPGKIKAGEKVNVPISTMNLAATIFDYLGIKNKKSDGTSLRPLIEEAKTDKFDFVVTEWNFHMSGNEPNYMIVKGNWKMFIPYNAESKTIDVLYDLKNDQFEMTNLLGNNPDRSKFEAKANELKQDLLSWLKQNHSIHYDGVLARQL
jgi:arylsulfatase A-like enzyme